VRFVEEQIKMMQAYNLDIVQNVMEHMNIVRIICGHMNI